MRSSERDTGSWGLATGLVSLNFQEPSSHSTYSMWHSSGRESGLDEAAEPRAARRGSSGRCGDLWNGDQGAGGYAVCPHSGSVGACLGTARC